MNRFSDSTIKRFLQQATPEERMLFQLKFVEQLGNVAITMKMFMSNSTICYKSKKIREKLQEIDEFSERKDSSSLWNTPQNDR